MTPLAVPGSRRPVADVVDVVDVGATNSRGVFTSAGYFDSLATPESLDVKRRYTARYGEHAPVLNSPGESCYEGMRLLSELLTRAGSVQVPGVCRAAADTRYESPRGEVGLRDAHVDQTIYLAQAHEIAATLFHVGVPRQEHGEFIAIIESYRSTVVGPPGDKDEQAVVQLRETVSV